MTIPRIKWTKRETDGYSGVDQDNNKYSTPANQETVQVRTPDGFTGYGWSVEEALNSAIKEHDIVMANHYKHLEEMKRQAIQDQELETYLKKATAHELKDYIRASEFILQARTKVLEAIPECPLHGQHCIPHAIEWIKDNISSEDH